MLAMVAEGHEVKVFVSETSKELSAAIGELGVEVESYPLSRTGRSLLADMRTYKYLTGAFSNYQPELLFSFNIKAVVYSSLAARAVGGVESWSLVSGLGHLFIDESLKTRVLRRLVTPLYKAALSANRGQFFQNGDDLAELAQHGIADPKKATMVAGSGVDLDHFKRCPLPEDPITFLFVGRYLREKGLRELIAAFDLVKEAQPDAILRLVGAPDDNPSSFTAAEMETLVSRGLVDNLGWIDDVRPAIRGCHVMVLPSYREGTPRSVLEAMAMGRAIITTDVPGCRETVVDGHNGLLVPVRNPEALSEAMLKLARDPGLVKKMGEASYQLAKERFDVHKVNDVMLRAMGLRVD